MATDYEKEAFGSSRDGVNFSRSTPASSDDGFPNASVQGGDNRNDEPLLSLGQSLGGGRFVGNQTMANQANYGQNTRPSYSQDNLSLTQRNNLMQQMGITEDNPYGFQNRFSEVTGLNAKNLSYANLLSLQQRQGIMQLTLDRYLDPMSDGQLRPGMRSGDITQYGTVQSVPKSDADMNMAEKLLSNSMLGGMFGLGRELRLTDSPLRTESLIPASASVAEEDPRYTSSGAYNVETPEFLQNTMDSITSGIGSLREKFSPDPNLSVDIGVGDLGVDPMTNLPAFGDANLGVGRDKEARTYNPAQELRDKYSGTMNAESTDLTTGDQAFLDYEFMSPAQMLEATKGFMNPKGSEGYNPNTRSITPTFKNPDFDRGGRTMGLEYSIPLQDLFNRVV